jgi:hypothetical protein
MASMMELGPAVNPIRQPVIEYVLDTPWTIMVLSLISLPKEAMLTYVNPS